MLYLREHPEHCATVDQHQIKPIDLVVVNLYPFEATIAKPDVTLDEAIENIDIGGPSMLRSAAKNHLSVTVVVDPADYSKVGEAISQQGHTSLELRRALAAKVYARTAAYDVTIANHLEQAFENLASEEPAANKTPNRILLHATKAQDLRYGENPHQEAALYGPFGDAFEQHHGKALSYNNILDLTAAQTLISEFEGQAPTLAILKHTTPVRTGSESAGSLGKGFCNRSSSTLRRHHRLQQRVGWGLCRGHFGYLQRGDRRTFLQWSST